jgi:hypothetical protein
MSTSAGFMVDNREKNGNQDKEEAKSIINIIDKSLKLQETLK